MTNSNISLFGFEESDREEDRNRRGKVCFYLEMPVKEHSCGNCGVLTFNLKLYTHILQNTSIFCECWKRFAEENPFVERYPGK